MVPNDSLTENKNYICYNCIHFYYELVLILQIILDQMDLLKSLE